jgi:hypothetical protein
MVMELLNTEEIPVDEICCDYYIAHSHPLFFQFIQNICGKEHKTFPIVFLDGEFIGGYTETKSFIHYANNLSNNK